MQLTLWQPLFVSGPVTTRRGHPQGTGIAILWPCPSPESSRYCRPILGIRRGISQSDHHLQKEQVIPQHLPRQPKKIKLTCQGHLPTPRPDITQLPDGTEMHNPYSWGKVTHQSVPRCLTAVQPTLQKINLCSTLSPLMWSLV